MKKYLNLKYKIQYLLNGHTLMSGVNQMTAKVKKWEAGAFLSFFEEKIKRGKTSKEDIVCKKIDARESRLRLY